MRRNIEKLARFSANPSLSIFFPTSGLGRTASADPIRLKNAIRDAEQQLIGLHGGTNQEEGILRPLEKLVDDREFWRRAERGLALYVTQNQLIHIWLPWGVEELTVVGTRFHIKPLLPLIQEDQAFRILALSGNQVRLFTVDRSSVSEIPLEGSFTERLGNERETVRSSLRSHARGTGRGRGSPSASFHGVGDDERESIDRRLLHELDQAVCSALPSAETPLVLAATERLQVAFRDVSRCTTLVDAGITGNAGNASGEELRELAWPLVQPSFHEEKGRDFERLRNHRGSPRRVDGIRRLLPAAFGGRLDTLIVSLDDHIWGLYDSSNDALVHQDLRRIGDEDLLDRVAVEALLRGTRVYAVHRDEIPTKEIATGLLREKNTHPPQSSEN